MPICCEPGQRYPIVLDGDKGKDPEPTFWCRHLSARRYASTVKVGERTSAEPDAEKRVQILADALAESLIDFADMTWPDGKPVTAADGPVGETLADLLTLGEMWGLWEKIIEAHHPRADDKKKSGSPSPSDGDSTAAAGGRVDAATAPAPQSR